MLWIVGRQLMSIDPTWRGPSRRGNSGGRCGLVRFDLTVSREILAAAKLDRPGKTSA